MKGVADIKLPSFESLTDTVKGAGIAGEYDSPTIGHFKAMQLELTWRTVGADLVQMMSQTAQRLDCRGAFQEYDAANGTYAVRQVRVVVQGPSTKNDFGKMENGATTNGTSTVEVMYIRIDIDGVNVVELDKLNYKYVVNGIDYLASVRNALGL